MANFGGFGVPYAGQTTAAALLTRGQFVLPVGVALQKKTRIWIVGVMTVNAIQHRAPNGGHVFPFDV